MVFLNVEDVKQLLDFRHSTVRLEHIELQCTKSSDKSRPLNMLIFSAWTIGLHAGGVS
jgi:hypothetical protein